jgi:hypothetical protein
METFDKRRKRDGIQHTTHGPQDAEGFNACVGCRGIREHAGIASERVKRNQDGIASLGPTTTILWL